MFDKYIFAAGLALAVGPVWAAPATQDGADHLKSVFEAYLGQTEGVVTVTPNGEVYDLSVDPANLIARAPEGGKGATVSSVEFQVAELGGGKWQVSQEGPADFSMTVPGVIDLRMTAEDYNWNGVFDETLKAFEASTGTATGVSLTEAVTQPGQPTMNVAYTLDSVEFVSNATAGAAGGVDGTMSYVVTGMVETFTLPPTPQMPAPMDITVTADSYTADGTMTGVRTAGLLDLWAWFVAHPGEDAVKANFDEMKGKIGAALPFFGNIAATGTINNLAVITPMGEVKAATAEIVVDVNGAVADGKLRERIKLSGLDLPEEIMPAWVPALLPETVTLDFTIDGFDLAAPARILVAEMAPDTKPSPEMNQRMLQALLPSGTVNVALADTGAASGMYGLTVDGKMAVGPMSPMPIGNAVIRANGLDAVMQALQSAPPEVSQQAIPGIMMARGLAKPEGDDSYSWTVETTAAGQILINGVDMAAMGGGAQ